MLTSKLWTFPSVGIKKNDITDVHSELHRLYKWIFWSTTFFNPDMMFTGLHWQREKSKEVKIYTPEAYKSPMLENFWESKNISVVLNDQIGDSILTVPLLMSLFSLGKQFKIYWKNVWLIKKLLDSSLWKLASTIEYSTFDFKKDEVAIGADDFCINIHRIYQPSEPPRRQYLSLDWRMLPLFDAELYSFPDRFVALVEILFWYKNNDQKDTRTVVTGGNVNEVLFVPFSSLPDKEIPESQWIDVLWHLRIQNPDTDFTMVSNGRDWDINVDKYAQIAKTMEQLKFKIKTITLSLEDLFDYLVANTPYVVSSETWVGHLTSAVGLKSNLLFTHGDYDFWSFNYDNVKTIPTMLARYLRLSQHWLFDPAWKNTKMDPNFQPFLENSIFDTPYIIRSLLK